MRKLLIIALLATGFAFPAIAQVDSASIAKALSMLDDYIAAMEGQTEEVKAAECDFIIGSSTDSLLRQELALKLYSHYAESPLMGDETMAVHIYDAWFASGKVRMKSDADLAAARTFAEFNRSSLTGRPAPVLRVESLDGTQVDIPSPGDKRVILYFYDASCAKCNLESILLRHYLESEDVEAGLVAFYCGSDRKVWEDYARESLSPDSGKVTVTHAWDPEAESDFVRLYGILQTPRLFLIDKDGTIIGRRLDVEALRQLLELGKVTDELTGRNPVGERLPSIKVPGTWKKGSKTKDKTLNLKCIRGNSAYLFFYSHSCQRCEHQMKMLEALLSSDKKSAAFLVDMDQILADNPELAGKLFDSFDLTVLPHIISIDRRGRISARYVEFR